MQHSWLPNFFIAGAPKAGTSSVHQWIADHPDALGSNEKETYFFVDPGTHMYRPEAHVSKGFETWRDQFDVPNGAAPKVIVESTPGYIYYETAQREIPLLETAPKCLFILREPSAQIFSLYTYFRNNWDWIPGNMSFAAFLEAVDQKSHAFKGNELARNARDYAHYAKFLRIWRENLGDDRMMVASFDELLADEKEFTKKVAAWVGLDPAFYDTYDFPRENETYVPKNRTLQRLNVAIRGALPKGAAYNKLREIYRSLNTSTAKTPKTEDETALLDDLKASFQKVNAELSDEFGVQFKDAPAFQKILEPMSSTE